MKIEMHKVVGVGSTSGSKLHENVRQTNRQQGLKLIMKFYNTTKQFSGSVRDD